jgi:mannose-6-phosphate isomerase
MCDEDDPGLLFMLFLKRVSLAQGESVFIPANLPHAYLMGDLVECMANSDNVVRAGLTDKFIDTETFLSFVDLSAEQDCRLQPICYPEDGIFLYTPPVPEFQLLRYSGSKESSEFRAEGAAIFFCLEGSVTLSGVDDVSTLELRAGQAAFLPAMSARPIIRMNGGELFVAHCSPQAIA